MRFETVKIETALGWRLAHSHTTGETKIPKNTLLTEKVVSALLGSGIQEADAYLMEDGDIQEDFAAEKIARTIAGKGLKVGPVTRGRANIYATSSGLFRASQKTHRVNQVSSDIGVSTLPDLSPVQAGKLVATVKVIPYAVLETTIKMVQSLGTTLELAPFSPFKVSLIMSGEGMTEKALRVTESRLSSIQGQIAQTLTCPHTVAELSDKLKQAEHELVLVSGISAISDRRDTVPGALEVAGGEILHLGMPVDPGNLLMLGRLSEKTVIGMPGCSKSPALNGFDWVLERYAARLPLNAEVIQSMGIGGLLKETADRPSPRAPNKPSPGGLTQAILLAGGNSSRSGKTHKLLADLDGKPVIEQTVLNLKNAGIGDIIVVTGARKAEIEAALGSQSVEFVHNPRFADGMSTSISAGVAAIKANTAQTLICLADMPFVASETYEALLGAAEKVSEADIFVPRFKGKRGNPVLWRKNMISALSNLSGDTGGRVIMQENVDKICEVDTEDPGVLIDLDTPEALAQFGIMVTKP